VLVQGEESRLDVKTASDKLNSVRVSVGKSRVACSKLLVDVARLKEKLATESVGLDLFFL
jgi:hypothetical protein